MTQCTGIRNLRQHAARLLAAGFGWVPLTARGLGVVFGLVVVFEFLGRREADHVALGLGALGLLVFGISASVVLLTALWLRVCRLFGQQPVLELETSSPARTGLHLRGVRWVPLVDVEILWVHPGRATTRLVTTRRGLSEEVTPLRRGVTHEIVRRFSVSDLFGLSRITFRRRDSSHVTVLPSSGRVLPLSLIRQRALGDSLPHPEGRPEGDLIEMRRYGAGDPLKLVLWKVFARTGRLLVREAERSISEEERTMAYFVAGPNDDATAGVARLLVTRGALGASFLFGADGSDDTTAEAGLALEWILRSAAWKSGDEEGLAALMEAGLATGLRDLLLFVPATHGPWLERVLRTVRDRPVRVRALMGVDGLPSEKAHSRWHRLVFRPDVRESARRVAELLRGRLEAAGISVQIVDRGTGALLSTETVKTPQVTQTVGGTLS